MGEDDSSTVCYSGRMSADSDLPLPPSSPAPSAPPAPPARAPWWKRPSVWLVGLIAGIAAIAAALLREPVTPLVFSPLKKRRSPQPPPPPDVQVVKIPDVDTRPADAYEASKVQPADPASPTDAEVDAALARLNAGDGK